MNSHGIGDGADGDRGGNRERARTNSQLKSDELRPPHMKPSDLLGEDRRNNEMVVKSNLSPNAEEFIPRNYNTTQHSVQNRLLMARHGGHNSQPNNIYMPQHNYYQDNQYHPIYIGGEASSNDFNIANQRKNNEPITDLNVTISQMESSMRVLTMSPGEFDRLVSHLVDIISPFLENPSQLKEIISSIIKQSINEGNFRYNGARLCTHLDTVANPNESSTTTFRNILIQQCDEEREAQSRVWLSSQKHSEDEEKKAHGLILFLAELVTQMQSSAPTLGKMLIQLMSTVLQNPAPSSTKNICQALKLAGQTLERESANPQKDMETVMRQLTDLVVSGRVDQSVGRMVNSVTELRSNSWGRTQSITPAYRPPAETQNMPGQSNEALDEPVFYGPDGQVISAEESAFLHVQASNNKQENLNEEYIDHDFAVDPEEEDEDDEIAAAYEDFLKDQELN